MWCGWNAGCVLSVRLCFFMGLLNFSHGSEFARMTFFMFWGALELCSDVVEELKMSSAITFSTKSSGIPNAVFKFNAKFRVKWLCDWFSSIHTSFQVFMSSKTKGCERPPKSSSRRNQPYVSIKEPLAACNGKPVGVGSDDATREYTESSVPVSIRNCFPCRKSFCRR